jgi:hypothetical protein
MAERVRLLTAEREGVKASQKARNHMFFLILAAGKLKRTRSSHHDADENACLVDFFISERIFQLPPSIFLESMLLRRWQ